MAYRIGDLTANIKAIKDGLSSLNNEEDVNLILEKLDMVFNSLYDYYKDKNYPFSKHCYESNTIKINTNKKITLVMFNGKLKHSNITHSSKIPYTDCEISIGGDAYGFIHIFFSCNFGDIKFKDKWVFFWEHEHCNMSVVTEDINRFFSQLEVIYNLVKSSGTGIISQSQVMKYISNAMANGVWSFTPSSANESDKIDSFEPDSFHPQQFLEMNNLKTDQEIKTFIDLYDLSLMFYKKTAIMPVYDYYIDKLHLSNAITNLEYYISQIDRITEHFKNVLFVAMSGKLLNIDEYSKLALYGDRMLLDYNEPYKSHVYLMKLVPTLYLRGCFKGFQHLPKFVLKVFPVVQDYNLLLDNIIRNKLTQIVPYTFKEYDNLTIDDLLLEKQNQLTIVSVYKVMVYNMINYFSEYYNNSTPIELHAQRKELETKIFEYLEEILHFSRFEKELFKINELINEKESL